MGNIHYLLSKNKSKIFIGVAVLALLIIVLIVILRPKGKEDTGPDVDASNGGQGATSINVTEAPSPVPEYEVVKEEDKQVVLRIKEENSKITEIVLNKSNGSLYIFENGVQTNRKSAYSAYRVGAKLLELSEDATLVRLDELDAPKVDGIIEVDINTSSGVIKQLIADGATVIREVAASDYIDCYLRKSDGTVSRIVVMQEVMFMLEFERENLPDISMYLVEL